MRDRGAIEKKSENIWGLARVRAREGTRARGKIRAKLVAISPQTSDVNHGKQPPRRFLIKYRWRSCIERTRVASALQQLSPNVVLLATMATPWLTGVGAVGHMRIRLTVEAHVAAQEREIAIGFVKE
jgi:hypothetical protein